MKVIRLLGMALCVVIAFGFIGFRGVQSHRQQVPRLSDRSSGLFTAGVAVATQHNDNLRTGAYLHESRITVTSLKSRGMIRRYEISVGAGVETQVLYVPNVYFSHTFHNVAYVTTVGNQVLAFDANTGSQLWSVSLTSNSNPGGIHSTPVIDFPNSTMYLLYRTTNYCTNDPTCSNQQQQSATVSFRLAALDIRTGATLRDQQIPAILSTAYGRIPFIAAAQYSRPGLLLNSYGLYVAFGARSEGTDPYRGWLLKIDPATLLVQSAFTPSPHQQAHSASGIWQSGGGIASDESGNIYVTTGNGPPDLYYSSFVDRLAQILAAAPQRIDLGCAGDVLCAGGALLKLNPELVGLKVFGPDGPWWPADGQHTGREWLNRDDLDFGSGGVVLLPGNTTAHNVVSGGKPGRLYLTDDQLNYRQGFQAFLNMYLTNTSQPPSGLNYPPYWDGGVYRLDDNPHLHGTPVYWRGPDPNLGYVYAWSEKDNLKEFKYYLNTKKFGPSFTPIDNNTNPWAAHCPATNGDFLCNGLISPNETECSGDRRAIMPGGMLSLSANGTAAGTGVLWATLRTSDRVDTCDTRDKLLAYDAAPGLGDPQTLRLIWQDDFGWANNAPLNSSPKWGVPTVADGKLLVGTSNGKLLIYELPLNAPVAVRASGSSDSGPIRVTWAIDDPGTDSFDVQVMGSTSIGILSGSTRSHVFNSLPSGLSSQIRVCSHMRGDQACSAWIQPVNTQFNAWFDITKPELDQTRWGFENIKTVLWAQAARAAYSFCTNNGFVGGQLNGYQVLDSRQIVSRVGVICNGTSVSRFFDSTIAERSRSAWGNFSDVNTVGWAQVSRLADEYCMARMYRGGQFNGNEYNGLMGIICYQGTWFDVPKPEVNPSNYDLNLVTDWSEAAREAKDACVRRQQNVGGGNGRFNGWQSNRAFGIVCY